MSEFWELKRRSQQNRKRRLSGRATSSMLATMDAMTITAGVGGAANLFQIVKGITSALKEGGKAEAIGQVIELQMLVSELIEKNRLLADENRELRAKLKLAGKMTFKKPFYYQVGDLEPFCPKCWEAAGKAIHVDGPIRNDYGTRGGFVADCPNCEGKFHSS